MAHGLRGDTVHHTGEGLEAGTIGWLIDAHSTRLLAGAAWKQEVEMKVEMGQGWPLVSHSLQQKTIIS